MTISSGRFRSEQRDDDGRFIKLDGTFNFRDLGGYPTSGGRMVQRGVLYRSDALHRLSARGRADLDRLGVRTVIDLRTHDEVAERAWLPDTRRPGRWLHRPLRASAPSWIDIDPARVADPDLAVEHYVETTRDGAGALVSIVSAVAEPDCKPVVFHCAAGKDRTGIVAAIVLQLLGVSPQVIADDYALSDVATELWEQSLVRGAVDDTQTAWAYVPPAMLSADRVVMTRYLHWLENEHGSAAGLLSANGLAPAKIEQLQDTFLVDGDDSVSGRHERWV